MSKFAIKKNKCLEEIVSEIAIVRGSKDNNEDRDYVAMYLDYPEGFDFNNTRILSVNYRVTSYTNTGFSNGNVSVAGEATSGVCSKNDGILVSVGVRYGTMYRGTYEFEAYLLKVE